MKPIKLQEENLRAIQNLLGLPENEFAAMVQSGLPKIQEFFNATLESLTKDQAVQLAKDKDVSFNKNQDSLDDFHTGFISGWMDRHHNEDIDDDSTAEDAYGDFLSSTAGDGE